MGNKTGQSHFSLKNERNTLSLSLSLSQEHEGNTIKGVTMGVKQMGNKKQKQNGHMHFDDMCTFLKHFFKPLSRYSGRVSTVRSYKEIRDFANVYVYTVGQPFTH